MLAWTIFHNYLFSKRSGALVRIIAWHCVLGIGMGVAALLVVLSVMNGFNLTIRSRMLSVDPHLVIKESGIPSAARQAEALTQIKPLSKAGVAQIDRFETQDLIVRSMDGVFNGALAKGYDDEALLLMLTRVWKSVRSEAPPPDAETAHLASDEIIMGVDLARAMGVFEGDQVLLVPPETLLLPKGEVPKFQKFKIKSLLSTQTPEFDAKLIFYSLEKFPKRLRSVSREAGFEVRLNDPYEAERLKKAIAVKGFESQTWGDRDTSLFFALKMESFAMALFLLLAVLITSFSIVTVMILLMSQKRQDLGLFMALGMSVKRTRWVFLQVGLLLSYVGILSGLILGGAICLALEWYPMELLPDIYTDSTLPAKLTLRILGFVLLASTLVAVMGSWLPVWRYVLSSPSEALRKTPAVTPF